MKPDKVNKLYSKLTPQEQAALVIEAASRQDESTVDAVLEHVERKHYLTAHADYTQQINALQWLICIYGTEYWKNRALMLMACTQVDEGNQEAEEAVNRFFAKTIALEHALIDACRRFKVDIAAIKAMASCVPNEAEGHPLPKADARLVEQYREIFDSLMPK